MNKIKCSLWWAFFVFKRPKNAINIPHHIPWGFGEFAHIFC
ncbi:hypothetical protein VCHA50P415_110111 [Vibrio chagasii]|nr:hypothetical protein VCHA30O60_110141 [Vibrio chagasii]CAH6804451.1 hypothetical protein VCHA36P168_100214 [Vibrio chagasii]CAH6804764.1 hypothetical protein VCHA31O71_120025 [Vibrio chagasii]CAH6806381.1 hypothetical protein VCHA36O163_120110 [Vibrio chagasii]CAH6809866.1 hypothetical protein VCHA34P131_130024 [Vibrio chagasii]